jgi:hypothetical protein
MINSPEETVAKAQEIKATDAEALEFDRLLLRLFEHPDVMSYLSKEVRLEDGKCEMDFYGLSNDAIEDVKKLIGPIPSEVYEYQVDGRDHIGFKFNLKDLADLNKEEDENLE